MSTNLLYAAIAAIAVGFVMFLFSSKERGENGEWSSALQWGYLLIMVGIFGVLSFNMSFTAVLLVFVAFTGIIWLIHKFRLSRDPSHKDRGHFTDYMSGFFPIILFVFVLRTFVAEPFQIPSSSMRPGLVVGDFILVNKFAYGIRKPIINDVLVETGKIQRGDVVVFNYPEDTSVNYIKRAVGLPGDVVEYNTRQYGEMDIEANAYHENIGDHSFRVLKMAGQPSFIPQAVRASFPFRDNCEYAEDGSSFKCIVPKGHYFMMGDNRDNSEDSRYWGFVDDQLIVGKAFFIWMNFRDKSRIGKSIQ